MPSDKLKNSYLYMICYPVPKESPSVLLPDSIPSTGEEKKKDKTQVKEIKSIKGTAKAAPWILTSMNDRELTV